MPFRFESTPLAGVTLVVPLRHEDSRGWFEESFKASEFDEAGLPTEFVQDNVSLSAKGVLRGLHFQKGQHAQAKLIRVLSGSCWDVGVDLRRESPTFGRWFSVELNSENQLQLYLPQGFAHGFVSLAEGTLIHYKCTAEYCSESEGGVVWNDPDLAIDWPKLDFSISLKDTSLPRLSGVSW